MLRAGEVIDTSYVLGELLGVGGMGVVYTATQRSLGRTVAIKLPRPELADDPMVRGRFRSEALAGSLVNHPNVVRVLDAGEHQGAPYLVMERVVGPPLGQLLRERGPMPSPKAVELVRQIVGGLADVHANDIVHADVKSDNILVETARDGSVVPRLIDFGIARFRAREVVASAVPMVSGTPEYLAPEVISGGAPTFASDVYAIGVVLYELLTGATPFAGGGLEDDAVPMTWRCPELQISPDLDAVVVRALARDPAGRYADAAALGRVLDAVAGMSRRRGLSRARSRKTSKPASAETTTARLSAEAALAARPLEPAPETTPAARRRSVIAAAITTGDLPAAAIGYLDLARALIDAHDPAAAIAELEEGIALLTLADGPARVWPLLLTLAAVHDGLGDRPRARGVASAARAQAAREGSQVGAERAERLCLRLAGRRSSARRSSPW